MTCLRCHNTGEMQVTDPDGYTVSLPCDACELREWIERATKAEAALSRERHRVRQLRRAVLAWAGRWAEAEASAQLRFNPEICEALVERSDSAWVRARDRSHDDE